MSAPSRGGGDQGAADAAAARIGIAPTGEDHGRLAGPDQQAPPLPAGARPAIDTACRGEAAIACRHRADTAAAAG